MKALLLLLLSFNAFSVDPKDFKTNKNWLIEANKGNVKNHSMVHKFGWRVVQVDYDLVLVNR